MATNTVETRGDVEVVDRGTTPINRSAQEESLGDLLSGLTTDFSTLVREEVALARTEIQETISKAISSAVGVIAGGLLAYAGFIMLLIAVAIALGPAVGSYWLSSLIVGLIVIIVGAILLVSGINTLKNLNPVPEKTIETLKNDAQWAKEEINERT